MFWKNENLYDMIPLSKEKEEKAMANKVIVKVLESVGKTMAKVDVNTIMWKSVKICLTFIITYYILYIVVILLQIS